MQRDPLVYLDDIIQACRKIERYTSTITFEQFQDDEKTIDAVVRNFEIIGEAVKNVPADIRGRMPEIEWSRAAGMRDVLAHGYFNVNLRLVWDAAMQSVPPLAERVTAFLAAL